MYIPIDGLGLVGGAQASAEADRLRSHQLAATHQRLAELVRMVQEYGDGDIARNRMISFAKNIAAADGIAVANGSSSSVPDVRAWCLTQTREGPSDQWKGYNITLQRMCVGCLSCDVCAKTSTSRGEACIKSLRTMLYADTALFGNGQEQKPKIAQSVKEARPATPPAQ
eukprot:1672594-Pyramimonas_sp.AAC.1